jgi:two-component system, NarL family, invasion response regulator UvrY
LGHLTRVLCVDDRKDVADSLRLIISSEPTMQCVGCLASANDLVEQVQNCDPRPDVVILDATMPGKDPLVAIEELAVACPSTRAIVYSGRDDAALVRRAREKGAWAFVSKHDDPRALLRAVREVAAGKSL